MKQLLAIMMMAFALSALAGRSLNDVASDAEKKQENKKQAGITYTLKSVEDGPTAVIIKATDGFGSGSKNALNGTKSETISVKVAPSTSKAFDMEAAKTQIKKLLASSFKVMGNSPYYILLSDGRNLNAAFDAWLASQPAIPNVPKAPAK